MSRHTNRMTSKEFELKVYSLRDKLYRFANRLINNSEEATDAVHDTMLKLWKGRKGLKSISNIDSYAYTILKNICFDIIKHRKVRENNSKEILYTETHREIAINEASEKLMHVRNIINTLPEIQKLIIQLRDVEELEIETICKITGLKENAVRTNLSRARQKVRIEIEKIYSYGLEEIRNTNK